MFSKDGPTLGELLTQALSSTQAGYDLLAPKFDHTPFRTPDVVVERALEGLGEVDDAIDLCCGTGAALLGLKPLVRRRLVGVDFSQRMLDVAKERLGATRAALELQKRDIFDLDERAAYDLVTSFGAFGHILEEAEPRFLDIVHRLLRPGGRFVFVTAREPGLLSRRRVAGRAFNAAMRVRNAVVSPPFVMYYLTFLLPRAERLLRWHDFTPLVEEGRFAAPYEDLVRVVATRR